VAEHRFKWKGFASQSPKPVIFLSLGEFWYISQLVAIIWTFAASLCCLSFGLQSDLLEPIFSVDCTTMINSQPSLHRIFLFAGVLMMSANGSLLAAEEPSADQLAFFEAKVRPLLAKHCYECHSAKAEKLKGGLLLDSQEGWTAGGDSGDAIEPGNAAGSLLMESVRYKNPDLQMPPKYQLAEAEIAVLETWIMMGAPDPRTGTNVAKAAGIDWEKGKSHWAFQPISKSALPVVKNSTWSHDDLDRFILSGIEAVQHRTQIDLH
jgi:mono/diheme cytochrome c family protein